jgi:hypothetical protein
MSLLEYEVSFHCTQINFQIVADHQKNEFAFVINHLSCIGSLGCSPFGEPQEVGLKPGGLKKSPPKENPETQ